MRGTGRGPGSRRAYTEPLQQSLGHGLLAAVALAIGKIAYEDADRTLLIRVQLLKLPQDLVLFVEEQRPAHPERLARLQ